MKLRLSLSLLFAFTVSLGACSTASPDPKDDALTERPDPAARAAALAKANSDLPFYATRAVAVVDGVEISPEQYNDEVRRLVKASQAMPTANIKNYKTLLIDRLVNDAILERKIAKYGIKVTDAEAETAWNEAAGRFNSVAEFEELIRKRAEDGGPTVEEIKADVRRNVGYKKVVATEFPFEVTAIEARTFYDENAERFDTQEEVEASHILSKLAEDAPADEVDAAMKKAEDVIAKAKAGADFAELAREFSEGPTAPRGGALGFFTRARIVKPFSDAAFSLSDGEVSAPVRSKFGIHVIKRTDSKPASRTAFEEVEADLIRDLETKKEREAFTKLLEKAEKDYGVQRFEDAIVDTVTEPASTP